MTFLDTVRGRFRPAPRATRQVPAVAKPPVTSQRAAATAVETAVTATMSALVVIAAWLLIFAFAVSRVQASHDQANLYDRFRSELAQATAPLGGDIHRGAPVAMLQAEHAHVRDLIVVEGSQGAQLRHGPGLYPSSPLPGQAGNVTIMGRGSTFGGPFSGLEQLRAGDTITATTGQGVFRYKVIGVRRTGDPLPAPVADGGSRLTLVSTAGASISAPSRVTRTVFVDADLVGKAQPHAAGYPIATSSDAIMAVDTSGLYALVLWLQLLFVASLLTVWAAIRWASWQAWVIGTPVVLVGLWGATNCASVLLPNLV